VRLLAGSGYENAGEYGTRYSTGGKNRIMRITESSLVSVRGIRQRRKRAN
jgi:hypothetical protein